jgi:membrane protease YdiL (CAAX protease family)
MSVSFLNKLTVKKDITTPTRKWYIRWGIAALLIVGTGIGFLGAQILVAALGYELNLLGVSFTDIDQTVLSSISAVLVYVVTLVVVIGIPLWLMHYRTSKQDIGMTRLMSWTDIGLAPVGGVIYFLSAALLAYIFMKLIPGIDLTQTQETGFNHVTQYYQYLLVFIALVVVAPVAEEVIFRGYLYGKLRKIIPVWVAMILTSIVFGIAHSQWNVAIDVFALSMVLCSLREVTGNIWSGMLLHMLKNGLAYYILFINPALLHTMGG